MNNYRTLSGLLATGILACAFQAQAATTTTVLDGANSAMGVTGNGCLQNLVVAVGEAENCAYDGGENVYEWPPNSGSFPARPFGESTGPFNQLQYYDYTTTPAAFDDAAYVTSNGDGKIRRVINGNMTVDDQGNGFGADDLIGFSFTITSPNGGDIVRLGATGWSDRFTSMTQVLMPRVADSVTANAFGGFDYVIGTEGFPLLLTFTDPSADETGVGLGDGPCVDQTFGDMECGAGFEVNALLDPLRWTFYDDGNGGTPLWVPTDGNLTFTGGAATPPGQFDSPHDHYGPPASAGIGTQEGNIGARTNGAVTWNGSPTMNVICNDASGGTGGTADACQESKTSFNPLLNMEDETSGGIPEDADWDQVYLKVSTDARGNVLTAEGFDAQETQVFSAPVLCGSDTGAVAVACNSWVAGHFNIAGVVAVADTAETPVDTPINIDVLANDTGFTDPVSILLPGAGASTQGGTVVVNGAPGPQGGIDITYTPPAGYDGPDDFEYTVDDGTNSGTATVTLTVLIGAIDDTVSTRLNTAVNIPVGANDGGFSDPVTVTVTVPPSMGGTIDLISGSGGPMAAVTIDYTPNAVLGTATYTETFTYQVTDAAMTVDTAVVTITVNNELPVAVAATETVAAGAKVVTDVSTLPGVNLGDAPSVITAAGSTSVLGTEITYTAGLASDTYDYTITDADGETSVATVTVTVTGGGTGPQARPLAFPDTATVIQGEAVVDVTANDKPGVGLMADHVVEVTSDPSTGTTSVDANNVVTYRPDKDFSGTDSFEYTLTDEDGNTDTAIVTIGTEVVEVPLPSGSALGPWSLMLLMFLPWLRQRRK